MLNNVNLRYNHPNNGEVTRISGDFSDYDWETLGLFLKEAESAMHSKMLKHELSWSLKGKTESGITFLTFTSDIPPWEDVQLFLHKIRPFVLNKERTSFNKVCNTISKSLNHGMINSYICLQKDRYTGKTMQSQMVVKSLINENDLHGIVINSEETLNDYLNAYEYHRDFDKQKLIDKISAGFFPDFTKALFVNLLIDKAVAISETAKLIALITGKSPNTILSFSR